MEIRRERKVVSVLFVDLVGFTSRSESMGPEDVEVELSRYHSQVRGQLHEIGDLFSTARADLRAGGDRLPRALTYFRRAGAHRYVGMAEQRGVAEATP